MQSYKDFLSEILIPEQELQDKVKELGEQISRDHAGQDLHLVCILRGGVLFLTDLMRAITVPHSIDFMAISSYGVGAREASGHVRLTMDLRDDIQGRNVLLIEDIVDSGHTLASVLGLLATRNPATLKVCTLLDKAERRETEVLLDYVGFVIDITGGGSSVYLKNNIVQGANTNYYIQYHCAEGTNNTTGRQNFPKAGGTNPSDRGFFKTIITKDPDGYFRFYSISNEFTGSNVKSLTYTCCKTATITNITSLRVQASETNGIGAGSKFVLYKARKT